jgi:hypothetical protein
MTIRSMAKAAGKAIFLDHYLDTLRAAFTLRSLRFRYGVKTTTGVWTKAESPVPLDIVIPVIDKDADTLPFVIDSAREWLRHPITNIYLVCPLDSRRIQAIASEKGCVCIDEAGLLPITKRDIQYKVEGIDRSGWLYQQFLKWRGDAFTTEKHFLILDSDTVLIAPHVFVSEGLQYFDYCDTVHQPYFDAYSRLMGHTAPCPVSLTSHHALVDKEVLAQLKERLEKDSGTDWYRAIMGAIDHKQMSSHSDYDTYGQFFFETRKSSMVIRYWHNKSLPRGAIGELGRLRAHYRGRYRTLSFHEYRK